LHTHLGKHAQQAGSKVEPDRLRFDFSNPEGVGRERLRRIEETVNERVLQAAEVSSDVMPIAQARALGAMALFGEKYPENVRVVKMGEFSRELCGGTHLESTSEVGLFKIVGEESVSAGTRRIIALTGRAALELVRQEEEILADVASALKVPASQAVGRVSALLDEIKALKKQAAQSRPATSPGVSADELLASAAKLGEASVITAHTAGLSPDELRQLIDVLRRKVPARLAVLLASSSDGKVHLAAALTPDLIAAGLHAGHWLKEVAPVVGGGGGGRPDLAQAGGKNPERIPAALERALEFFRDKFSGLVI
jgi:alanyl-tRNA synthetase